MRKGDYFGNGAGPIQLSNPGGLSVYPVEAFQTQQLDLTVQSLGIEVVPARPGYVPILAPVTVNFLIEKVVGTQTSPLQMKAGSDPNHSNVFAATTTVPSNADVNGANVPSFGGTPTGAASPAQLFPNQPVILDITQGAQGTGGFVLRGKFLIRVQWVAVQ